MIKLIEKYYPTSGKTYPILLKHSQQVAQKAMIIARNLSTRQAIDLRFVEEAALLHDIGIYLTHAPEIGCRGELPYLAHGYLGRELLEREGLSRHALVCERHIGVGLSRHDIIEQSLPLPERDMIPETIEEQIITYADLFFSKSGSIEQTERPIELVRQKMGRHGEDKIAILDKWHALFSS